MRHACYKEQGWVHVPAYITESELPQLVEQAMLGSKRRVHVGGRGESWTEHQIVTGTKLHGLMTSKELQTLVYDCLGENFSHFTSLWASVYDVDEYIPWHKDKDGKVQTLLCLLPAPSGCGGHFCMKQKEGIKTLDLSAGDLLIFNATKIEHCTTPLTTSKTYANPKRIVAVTRFNATN